MMALRHRWIFLISSSSALLIGLIAASRLTGVLPGPLAVAETKTIQTVEFSMERADGTISVCQTLCSQCEDESARINASIFVGSVNCRPNLYESSFVYFCISVQISLVKGYVDKLGVSFHEDYAPSFIVFSEAPLSKKLSCLFTNSSTCIRSPGFNETEHFIRRSERLCMFAFFLSLR